MDIQKDSNKESLALNFNVPNVLTALRLLLTVAIVCLLILDGVSNRLLLGILLLIAWSTDWMDGYFARKLKQVSEFGALFDLTVDRIILDSISILSVFWMYWSRTSSQVPFTPYPYLGLIWAVDLTLLSGIVIFLYKRHSHAGSYPLPRPTLLAKLTFPAQMITLILAVAGLGPDILLAVFMYLTMIITIIGAASYLKKGGYVFIK
jgi:phosphatidylglycerophosphate synthase